MRTNVYRSGKSQAYFIAGVLSDIDVKYGQLGLDLNMYFLINIPDQTGHRFSKHSWPCYSNL